jgi:chemotaxis protein MotB
MLIAAACGCASQEKERISLLEDTNRSLTARLNAMRDQIDQAQQMRADCDRQLAAARQEANTLGQRLAELPPPQEAAPGWTATPTGAMIAIQTNVLFAPGKNTLRTEAQRTLDAIVSTLQGEYSGHDVLILGHTDDTPIRKSGWTDNWELSAERSLAVVRYLSERGVGAARLTACGGGEFRPNVVNNSESNRSQNRRVEIFAVDPALELGRP